VLYFYYYHHCTVVCFAFILDEMSFFSFSRKLILLREYTGMVCSPRSNVAIPRASAADLLKHPFVQNCKSVDLLVELVEKCKNIVIQQGGLYDDDDDAIYQTDNNNFNTVVGGESGTWISKGTFVQYPSTELLKSEQEVLTPPQTIKYGLKDELTAIYRKDCTIRIPFLSHRVLNPQTLLSLAPEENKIHATLAALTSTTAIIPPAVDLPATLSNLVKTLSGCMNSQPYSLNPQDGNNKASSNTTDLNTTLKTILRL